jgi:DNA-binding NarL/FixJ family response regulator
MADRIYIVEDHPIVRRGFASLIEEESDLTVCGETGSVRTARRHIGDLQPDLAIIDLFLEDGSGLTLIKDLKPTMEASLRALVISGQPESLYAQRVLAAGAHGYLMKSEAYWHVVPAIRRVLSGHIYLSEKMTAAILTNYVGTSQSRTRSPLEMLSDRELEVFTLLGNGLDRREIAEALSVSPKTIDTHQDHLKEKLALKNHSQLRRNAAVWVATSGPELE